MRLDKTPEEDVHFLDLVSEPLRIELHFEMYWLQLKKQPVFDTFLRSNPFFVRKICHLAMTTSYQSIGDTIFHHGEISDHMIIINHGLMRYSWRDAEDIEVGA